jgi:phosphate transport system substrate-binding protein
LQLFTRRVAPLLAPLVIFGLVAAACSSDSKSNTNTSTSTSSTGSSSKGGSSVKGLEIDYATLSATLNGSGSTFQAPLEEAEIAAFQEQANKVTINYGGGGSGKGKTDLHDQVVDYAGTDSLIKDADKSGFKGGDVLYFPFAAAPITVSYNLKGVSNLQLSPDTIAKIFQVQIKTWNDPAIAADNPGVTLPATPITVAHRSDGSGTTNNFTGFLDKAAKPAWTLGRGDTVNWDASTQGGNGNRGVAQIVQSSDGGIGYVDFADAKAANLRFASIKNAAGKFIAPSVDATAAALATTTPNADLTYDPLNAAGDTTYPIATPTWILVYKKQPDKAKGDAIKGFLNFILTDGQQLYADANYAPLPDAFRQKAIDQLNQITIG